MTRIDERREENLGVHKFVRICAVTSFYTFLTGAAFGFLGTSLLSLILVGIILTVVCVVGGAYVGYHFGYEQKTKVYLIGGILLLIGGVDVIIKDLYYKYKGVKIPPAAAFGSAAPGRYLYFPLVK